MVFTSKASARSRLTVLATVALIVGAGARAQQDTTEEPPATNLEIIRSLSRAGAARALQNARPGKVHISIFPQDVAWMIEGGVLEAARVHQLEVTEAETAAYRISFGVDDARVLYTNIRRDGLFGPRIVDRTVRLRLSAKIVDGGEARIVRTADIEESQTDTIRVADIAQVENPAVPFTKGTLPREGFFASLAEPLIVVGSVAIAVLLLFHVRS